MESRKPVSKVYLDYAATTPLRSEVLEAMMPLLKERFGNPSSSHGLGLEAREALEEARAEVARLIGAEPDEILFTSGGTEANNLAIQGIASAHRERGDHIITSRIEHPAVLNPCRFLESTGFKITYVGVDRRGRIDPDEVRKSITRRTILISLMHANNEIGTLQPIEEIARIARERNVPFHTDAIQSGAKVLFDVKALGVDALSLSGHKVYGPKGVGVLYLRKGTKMTPLLRGGDQERGYRGGTENVAGIVGMAHALRWARAELPEEGERENRLATRLLEGLTREVDGVFLNGDPDRRVPGHLHLSFSELEGQRLVETLDAEGIQVSTGSACLSLHPYPSPVLMAIGLPEEQSWGSIRISLGRYTNPEEIEYVLEVLPGAVKRCRALGFDRERMERRWRAELLEAQQARPGCEGMRSLAWSSLWRRATGRLFKVS